MIKIIAKLIADGGIPSKNSPNYSRESFLLANKNKNIYGIKVNLYQTKDNTLVALDDEIKNKLKIDDSYIKNHNYKDLVNLNLGTKVKKSNIVSLYEIAKDLDDNTNIIIDAKSYNSLNFITELKKTMNKFPNINWFIYSNSHFFLNELIKENKNHHIGIYITNEEDFNYSFDFYVIKKQHLNNNINNLSKIFIEGINSHEELKKLLMQTNLNRDNIYIINKNVNAFF